MAARAAECGFEARLEPQQEPIQVEIEVLTDEATAKLAETIAAFDDMAAAADKAARAMNVLLVAMDDVAALIRREPWHRRLARWLRG